MQVFHDALAQLNFGAIGRAIVLIVLGFLIANLLSISLNKVLSRRLTLQQAMLLRRIVFYFVFLIFLASAVQQMGFRISALLGATGILTVAIGIASQTSMSNVISGLFIIGEKPFQIGDTIKVNDFQGEVIAIDFFSVKIRTSENTLVRIPNETLIKSAITNISYFDTRRADLNFTVAYQSDIDIVRKVLLEVAQNNRLCLNDPKPSTALLKFNDTGMSIQLSVWSTKENYNDLKSIMQIEVKNAFTKNNIEIPSVLPRNYFISNPSTPSQNRPR